jgi:hypothetical protein
VFVQRDGKEEVRNGVLSISVAIFARRSTQPLGDRAERPLVGHPPSSWGRIPEMADYSATPLAKELGIAPESSVVLLAAVLQGAGLNVVEQGEVTCPFVFASAEASWRGSSSAGVDQAAISHSGEAAVRAVYAQADRAHTRARTEASGTTTFSCGSWANGRSESTRAWQERVGAERDP